MLEIPSKQQEKIKLLMQQVAYGFNAAKLDGIQQIKNITAVIVRTYAPNTPPPQTGWIWVDTVGGYSYISTGTTNVTDWSRLGLLGGSVGNKQIAIGNISGKIVSYPGLTYDNITTIFSAGIVDAGSYRLGGVPISISQQPLYGIIYPSGTVTPRYIGDIYINTVDKSKWRSYGIANTDRSL